MLNQFKSENRGALGEYVINNYNGTGYRLVTIASEFPGKESPNWGGGVGHWQVDYMITSTTFWSLMATYSPVAVMTTSRSPGNVWLLETGSTNLARNDWNVALAWNVGRPPFIGGAVNDPATPNTDVAPKAGNPPDATQEASWVRGLKDGVGGLQITIAGALNAEVAGISAVINPQVQGTPPDNYVSAFAGYHAVWYAEWKASCKAGWHTHVGLEIPTATASQAIKLQLDKLIEWLNVQ